MQASRGSWLPTAAVLLIGLLLPHPFLRGEDGDPSLLRAQAARERHADRARELIDRLDLSRLQARRLVPIAEQAAALHIEAYEGEAQLLPDMLEAFAEFAREDSLNQGFTRDVEQRTARLNRRAKEVRERLAEQLIALEEQASKVLEPSQRENLDSVSQKPRSVGERVRRTDARSRARAAQRQRAEARRRPLHEARQELSALYRRLHPSVGPIGQCLLHPFGADRLCKIARVRTPETLSAAADVLRHGTSEYPIELVERQKAEVRKLRAEINNWNLINGLHLGADQTQRITVLYDQAVAPTWEIVERDAGSGVPSRAIVALERQVERVLNDGQRQVLAEYKACLIPPKNLKDPVRIGQASDDSRYEGWLGRARKMSRRELGKHIELTLEKESEHFGELSRADRQKRVALLRKTVRQAATMSDTEFELSKVELAESIAPPDRAQEVKGRIAALARELGEPGALARFMLNPQFIEQLRLRGRQLAEGVGLKRADLAAGPQAENCDETCAIDGKRSKGQKR